VHRIPPSHGPRGAPYLARCWRDVGNADLNPYPPLEQQTSITSSLFIRTGVLMGLRRTQDDGKRCSNFSVPHRFVISTGELMGPLAHPS
jgi:hypothetical protein